MPGTQLTLLGISNIHPLQLRVQAKSVKYVNITSYYHYVHMPLSGIATELWMRDISDWGVFHCHYSLGGINMTEQ